MSCIRKKKEYIEKNLIYGGCCPECGDFLITEEWDSYSCAVFKRCINPKCDYKSEKIVLDKKNYKSSSDPISEQVKRHSFSSNKNGSTPELVKDALDRKTLKSATIDTIEECRSILDDLKETFNNQDIPTFPNHYYLVGTRDAFGKKKEITRDEARSKVLNEKCNYKIKYDVKSRSYNFYVEDEFLETIPYYTCSERDPVETEYLGEVEKGKRKKYKCRPELQMNENWW